MWLYYVTAVVGRYMVTNLYKKNASIYTTKGWLLLLEELNHFLQE